MAAVDHYLRVQLTDLRLIQRIRKLHEELQARSPHFTVRMIDVARLCIRRGLEVVEKETLIK